MFNNVRCFIALLCLSWEMQQCAAADTNAVIVGTTNGTFFVYKMLSYGNASAVLQRVSAVTQNTQEGATTEWVAAGAKPGTFYVVNNCFVGPGDCHEVVGYRMLSSPEGNLQVQRINAASSMGRGPCFFEIDSTGKWMLVSNYLEGNAAVLPIKDDGSLGAAVSTTEAPSGTAQFPFPGQDHSQAHCIRLDPYVKRFVIIADAGLDLLRHYVMNPQTGHLTENGRLNMTMYRPRHFVFHPHLHIVYVVHEIGSVLSVLPFNVTTGRAGPDTLQVLPTGAPDIFSGGNAAAEISLSPDSKFLLVSNRGHDTIAVYWVDASTGHLKLAAYPESAGGKGPRHFSFPAVQAHTARGGPFVLVGNSGTGSVAAFSFSAPQEDVYPTAFQLMANVTDAPGVAAVIAIPLKANDAPNDYTRLIF